MKLHIRRAESENYEVWSVWPPNPPSCKAGNVEGSGGIGHYACGAENQCLGQAGGGHLKELDRVAEC